MQDIMSEAKHILQKLEQDKKLCEYIDEELSIPKPYRSPGPIRLIVLGQDPTVQDRQSRRSITTTLNMDKPGGALWSYIACICNSLGIDISENLYATNLYKNFFMKPPTQIEKIDPFQEFLDPWLPLLEKELEHYPEAPVITLGEPILGPLLSSGESTKVRDYWGYTSDWRSGKMKSFSYIKAADNRLHRDLFPFPHLPSLSKSFYRSHLCIYLSFVKSKAF